MGASRFLEIICKRTQDRMSGRIADAIGDYAKANPFAQMGISGDVRGSLYPSTIIGQSRVWIISGCTPLGSLIQIEIEITHDETWIPVVVVSSTELDEPLVIVSMRHDDETFDRVMEAIDALVAAGAARFKYERERLPELLEGRTSFTFYV